ncbi:MAG: hypothetical protein AAF429_01205 [Pseudomonadota bacterium]
MINRRTLMLSALGAAAGSAAGASGYDYKNAPIHFIASLGAADATSGDGAETWGIWYGDPATRSVWLSMYPLIRQMGGFTPANWRIEEDDWWLDENGLIMQPPNFPIPAGKYLVTGDREVTTILTIEKPDESGNMKWSLKEGMIYDVTHLPCRSSRYTPLNGSGTCLPDQADKRMFPIPVGYPLPSLEACHKQDYAVLIVIGLPET